MCILEQSINKFLIDKPVDGYKKDLNVFTKFLKEEKKIDSKSLEYFLQGFRTNGIIESLGFYINKNGVTSLSAARRYTSCLREFFRYIILKNIIENNELYIELGAPAYDDNSYTHKINRYISEDKRLKDTEGFIAISEEDVKLLIDVCDETLDSQEVFEKAVQKQKYYNKFRSSLVLKLILLTGIRYNVLIEIKKNDLNLKHDLITINGITIHIPMKLSEQFEKYETINSEISNKNINRENLFIEYGMDIISGNTATTSSFLGEALGRKDLNGVIKYTIIEMIKKGINESIIRKFTGVGETIYNECQNHVNGMYNIKTNRYLDSKIRSMEIFDLL